jgi:hypothetical protein
MERFPTIPRARSVQVVCLPMEDKVLSGSRLSAAFALSAHSKMTRVGDRGLLTELAYLS